MREQKSLGRPREFDEDEALAQILDVFWAKGFEGTSMSDLEAATGLVGDPVVGNGFRGVGSVVWLGAGHGRRPDGYSRTQRTVFQSRNRSTGPSD